MWAVPTERFPDPGFPKVPNPANCKNKSRKLRTDDLKIAHRRLNEMQRGVGRVYLSPVLCSDSLVPRPLLAKGDD